MQHFADFYQLGVHSKAPVAACGTDAHLNIDGRFGLERARTEAEHHMAQMNKLGKEYIGYMLFKTRGTRTGLERPYFTQLEV